MKGDTTCLDYSSFENPINKSDRGEGPLSRLVVRVVVAFRV